MGQDLKFTDLDKKMRVFETAHDHCVLPGIFLVARIDGRCFSRLTKETLELEAPYDTRFRDIMLGTAEHLMKTGFNVKLAYMQSDEINLLLSPEESTFSRKLRKYNSILAGEASASFSLALGRPAAFDCRISQLPTTEDVRNYFRWRSEDALRNALNSHCYWHYRKNGLSESAAHQKLLGVSNGQKHDLLFQEAGINFNHLPAWQKRGFAVYWKSSEKVGVNPKTEKTVISLKSTLYRDLSLPIGEEFDQLIAGFCS